MVDSNVLKQLENVLIGYQENQETLTPVVSFAEKTFGDGWMSELTEALASSTLEPNVKKMLQDKADHAIHYYGALAAWEESTNYLEHKVDFDKALLEERLPVLEYWLALFGNDGANLVAQVKDLIATMDTQSAPQQQDATEQRVEEKEGHDVLPEPVPATETLNPEDILDDSVKTDIELPKTDLDANDALSPQKSDDETIDDVLSMIPVVASAENKAAEESVAQAQEEVVAETQTEEPVAPAQAQAQEEVVAETQTEEPVAPAQEEVVAETQTEEPVAPAQAPAQEEVVAETQTEESVAPAQEEVVAETQTEEPVAQAQEEVVAETQTENVETAQQESSSEDGVWQPEGYVQNNPLLDVEEEMTPVLDAREPVVDKRETSLDYDVAPTSKNWDIATFLRQKRLYEDACCWLDAWCIHMDNAEKTEYPYYGFIVDLMYDLKEKIQNVLENQLLEEVIEKDVKGGRDGIVRLSEALNKEIEGLTDDFKHSTAEKIKLSAREILGAIDTSTEKEDIGAAPDGFELMDDPYAVSADKIISDFEKTEQEFQNKIDKLNVIDENSSISKKG